MIDKESYPKIISEIIKYIVISRRFEMAKG